VDDPPPFWSKNVRRYSTILRWLRIEPAGDGRRTSSGASTGIRRFNPLCATRAVLAGPTTPALERHDVAVTEDLATPDTTRLASLYRADQAHLARRTISAQRLGELEVGRGVSEPEIGIVYLTWQFDSAMSADRHARHAEP
jgi:hypothetical protein